MNTTILLDDIEVPSRPSLATSFAPILAPWHALQRGFNARLPRERLLMIGVGLTLALAVADQFLIGPAFSRYRQATQQQTDVLQQQTRLQTDALQLGRQSTTQHQLKRAELQAWRDRVREGEAVLQRHEETLVTPSEMMQLLEQMLARHGQVKVLAVKQLDQLDLLLGTKADAAATVSKADAAAGGQPGGSLYRHGVELQLEGGFNDLLAYLQALESMPQHLLWGPMSLQVKAHPTSRLTLQLYTISRDRHWLEF